VLLPIPALWCVAAHYGWLDFLEYKTIDWRFHARGEIDAPVKIVYVDIDSQSLSEIGGFPWSRGYFAPVCAALLEQGKARAVGIDVVFSENGVAESVDWKKRVVGNREFAKYLAKSPPVVLAASYAAAIDRDINGQLVFRDLPRLGRLRPGAEVAVPELPQFRISEKDPRKLWTHQYVGLIDTIDGGSRTVPAFAPVPITPYFHLSIELARLYLGVERDGIKIADDHVDLVCPDGSRAARIPLREHQLIDVNWFSRWRSDVRNPRVGFSTAFLYADMLHSEKPEEREAAAKFFAQPDFADAIVLIGPVDPLLQDLATTPFDDVTAVPRVGIHGNVIKTIVSGRYLRTLPQWHQVEGPQILLVLGLAMAVAGLAVKGGVKSLRYKVAGASLTIAYVAAAFFLFKQGDYLLPLAAPLGAALSTTFVAVGWQLAQEEKRAGRIKGMFGTYLAPAVVEAMVESGRDPELGGHDAEITAYFSDIQSFSSFSEVLSSGKLTELLNEYLTA